MPPHAATDTPSPWIVRWADAIASRSAGTGEHWGLGERMASSKKGTVGVIGLGIMGGAFAQNLVAGGWRVIGYDIDPTRRRAMARRI